MSSTQPADNHHPDQQSFWSDLKDTFRGVPHDFTQGSIGRAIVLLSIPMVLEMLMQSIFGVVDVFFVSQLGADAIAAVGMTESLLVLVFAVGMGLSMAATAMVARRIGEKNEAEAKKASFQALIVTLFASIPFAVIGILFTPNLMQFMGASAGVIEMGGTYCTILLGTNILILYTFLINALFRGAGDAVLAMRVLWLTNIINIILDPMLIFGIGPFPELGVTGAAVATSIGRLIGVIYQFYILFRGNSRLKLSMDDFGIDTTMIRRLITIAWPGFIQYGVSTASWLLLFRIIALFGSAAMAGYTIAVRIIVFAILPSWGMGNAAATLVGQNLGANKPDRAERSVWLTAYTNMVFLGAVALIMFFFAEELIRIFTQDPEVLKIGIDCLQIVSVTYVFFAFGIVSIQAFNGAGDTKTPTWINLISYWIFQIPLAYFLSVPFEFGVNGSFIAIAVAQTILAIISMIWFKKGNWKNIDV